MNRNIKFTFPASDDPATEAGPAAKTDGASPPARRHADRPQRASRMTGTTGLRLLFLCGLLVMVIWAMNYSARPETWNWLFRDDVAGEEAVLPPGEPGAPESAVPVGPLASPDARGDTAGNPPAEPETGAGEGDESRAGAGEQERFVSTTRGSAARIEVDFWRQVLRRLDGQQQVRLYTLLHCAVRQKPLPASETATTSPILSKISRWRQKFHSHLVETGNFDTEFAQAWNHSFLPALNAVIGNRADPTLIDERLPRLAEYARQAALRIIEDNTPVNRPREAYAWFDAWADVFDTPIDLEIDQPVTVTELLAQPDFWRGKYVSISGQALRVEEIPASHNPLGIERYYVLWIKPDHPSSFPYCVYTLMAPEALVSGAREQMKTVQQAVVTNARFFKNRLFDAGQAAWAPVLMTASVEIPAAAVTPPPRRPFRIPGPNSVFLTLGLIGGFAALIAWTVFRSTLGGRARALPKKENLEHRFALLKDDQRVETTVEKLRRLSSDAANVPDDHPANIPDGHDTPLPESEIESEAADDA